jgi:beta-N-acetylhexosaminidase
MSAHLAFPNTPGGRTPASLSPWFLQDVLRGKLNFQGLIITDDLMMYGALQYTRSVPRAARLALEAGNDMIMLSTSPHLNDAVWVYLTATMRNNPAFRERVRDACRRVLQLKLEHLRGENKIPFVPDLYRVQNEVPTPEADAFFLGLAARSVTTINGENLFPLTQENAGRVLLAGNFAEFINAGQRAFPGATTFHLSRGPAALAAYMRNADTVIFCLSNAAGLGILQEARRLVGTAMNDRNVIVFSILNPVFLEDLYWANGAVIVYSYAPVSFVAGFSAILGRIPAQGRLPFSLRSGQ